jgi:hypothetical protein
LKTAIFEMAFIETQHSKRPMCKAIIIYNELIYKTRGGAMHVQSENKQKVHFALKLLLKKQH